MSEFWNNADEVYEAVAGMLEKAKEDPIIVKKTEGLDYLVLHVYHDPELKIWIDSRGDTAIYGRGDAPETPMITMSLSSDDAHRTWSNKLNVMLALTRKRLKIEGKASKLLKMTPLLRRWAVCYNAQLKDMGKDEIILS